MSVRSSWLTVLFSFLSLLIFCLLIRKITEISMSKSPAIVRDFCIFPSSSVRFHFMYFDTLLGAHTFRIIIIFLVN